MGLEKIRIEDEQEAVKKRAVYIQGSRSFLTARTRRIIFVYNICLTSKKAKEFEPHGLPSFLSDAKLTDYTAECKAVFHLRYFSFDSG